VSKFKNLGLDFLLFVVSIVFFRSEIAWTFNGFIKEHDLFNLITLIALLFFDWKKNSISKGFSRLQFELSIQSNSNPYDVVFIS
jgi:hypothetical protein